MVLAISAGVQSYIVSMEDDMPSGDRFFRCVWGAWRTVWCFGGWSLPWGRFCLLGWGYRPAVGGRLSLGGYAA